MIQSLRGYLLANLMVGVLFATGLAVLSNLYLGYKTIRPHLDAQMVVMAFTIDTFMTQDIDNQDILNKLHHRTANYVHAIEGLHLDDAQYLRALHSSLDNTQFSVFDECNRLIASSPKAPKVPERDETGFSHTHDRGKTWRFFTLHNSQGDRIVVMQPHDTRLFIEKNANTQAIVIIFCTIAMLGIFLWVIIGRSLESIDRTSAELKQRAHNNLQPIAVDNVPHEIRPLIHELNSLFSRLHDTFLRESRFAGDAAHEMKTPLAALKTYTQIALNLEDIPAIHNNLEKVLQGVDRASHTVDQLLILSRTMPDAHTKEHHRIDFSKVITDTLAALTPSALQKNIALSFEQNSDEPIFITGHNISLSILIRNLVDNAIRYSDIDTQVSVLLEQLPSTVKLIVIDQGPGIDENQRKRIFERFFRVLGSKASGSGLGLNIVQQIADLHQATIDLSTGPSGKGLKFTISFPLADHKSHASD